jgi:hypothetical protein
LKIKQGEIFGPPFCAFRRIFGRSKLLEKSTQPRGQVEDSALLALPPHF